MSKKLKKSSSAGSGLRALSPSKGGPRWDTHSLDSHLYRNAMARLQPHLSTMRCGRVDQSVKPAAEKAPSLLADKLCTGQTCTQLNTYHAHLRCASAMRAVVRGCGFVLNIASTFLVILFAVDSVNANMEGGRVGRK